MNKEERKLYNKKYYEKNKNQKWYLALKRKTAIIKIWKKNKVYTDNYENLHYLYMNTHKCYFCDKNIEGHKRCLEHNHHSQEIRGIVCHKCNYLMRKKDEDFDLVLNELKSNINLYE